MNFHILTILPEVVAPYFKESILGRACEKGIIRVFCHSLRDYAKDKHRTVDDRLYGGGSGMVFKPDVVVAAVNDLKKKHNIERVFLLSPRGILFNQSKAKRLTQYESLLLVCGRYEGVDERAINMVIDEEISIGDYVITGGELAAQIIVDAVARLIPGVVGDEEGPRKDSHVNGLLEHPQYTRPQNFKNQLVPEVLLGGNHEAIEKWRRRESLRITLKNRPELLERLKLTIEDKEILEKLKNKKPDCK